MKSSLHIIAGVAVLGVSAYLVFHQKQIENELSSGNTYAFSVIGLERNGDGHEVVNQYGLLEGKITEEQVRARVIGWFVQAHPRASYGDVSIMEKMKDGEWRKASAFKFGSDLPEFGCREEGDGTIDGAPFTDITTCGWKPADGETGNVTPTVTVVDKAPPKTHRIYGWPTGEAGHDKQ